MDNKKSNKLYIQLYSIHGLIRGYDLELGRDADTGGQTKYVLELARSLSKDPRVGKIELVTRQIRDKLVSEDAAAGNTFGRNYCGITWKSLLIKV